MSFMLKELNSGSAAKTSSKIVSDFIHKVIKATGAQERLIAQGIAMAESQFNRLASKKSGGVKIQTIYPLKRLEKLFQEAEKTFSKAGMKKWLTSPNPYLDDVPPILCLRTDKELDRVLSLLASIRYGFPA
ncbi:MAG: MbcA/ParS/Xre antitoxin family protein [Firmicutes bacterium]|nr:MbcA/ParS/Xre antitoxin family protein [Bacillota bacterium]